MFATVKQIFTPKNKDLRKKILFTLFVLSILTTILFIPKKIITKKEGNVIPFLVFNLK